jgi:outer membrane protein assembly factor BamE (lipoprotein component of BamABCDE complex)
MRKRLVLLLATFLLTACFPAGRDFATFPVEKIQPNVTTREEVYAAFGEPVERGSDSGNESWTYYYYLYSLFGPQRQKRLHVIFNQDGTVKAYSFSAG